MSVLITETKLCCFFSYLNRKAEVSNALQEVITETKISKINQIKLRILIVEIKMMISVMLYTEAVFSLSTKNFWNTVAFLFVFDKYCPNMD